MKYIYMCDDCGYESGIDDEKVKEQTISNMEKIYELKKDLEYLNKTIENKLELFNEIIPDEDETIPEGWIVKARYGNIYYMDIYTGRTSHKKPVRSSKKIIKSPWREIKYGMNQEDVLKILGHPRKRLCINNKEKWIYDRTSCREKNILYRGDVIFNVSKYDGCYLSEWNDPYYS